MLPNLNAVKRGEPIRRRPPEPKKQEPGTEPEETPQPGKEPEPEEEPKEEPEQATVVSMTAAQFRDIIQSVIGEARKPVTDEKKVAQQKRMREHNRMLQKGQHDMLVARFRGCNHMQYPGSVLTGCSVIGWATQSDGKKRGTCQHCGTVFSPVREECISDEVWQSYQLLVRLPTHPGGNVNSIFQSA